jgi:hypothetical protein
MPDYGTISLLRPARRGVETSLSEKPNLTVETLALEIQKFAQRPEIVTIELFGVTDGKAIGTYIECLFLDELAQRYEFVRGNAALGLDLPELPADIKSTSISQPQSSTPFHNAREKIFGVGYHLGIFVYEKKDHVENQSCTLKIRRGLFVPKERTGDYNITCGLKELLDYKNVTTESLIEFMRSKDLPDHICDRCQHTELRSIAEELIATHKLLLGRLTISNALQWRVQYSRLVNPKASLDHLLEE